MPHLCGAVSVAEGWIPDLAEQELLGQHWCNIEGGPGKMVSRCKGSVEHPEKILFLGFTDKNPKAEIFTRNTAQCLSKSQHTLG